MQPPESQLEIPFWRRDGFPYFRQSVFLRQRFGGRVQKVSLDGGFTCPNVDGTVAKGGCTFCDNRSFSPSRRLKLRSVADQLAHGKQKVSERYGPCRFLAYFQPATNTYAALEKLQSLYEIPLADPEVVGLIIGTRPDCVPDDVLDYLDQLAERTYVCVEFGMQSMHKESLDWMNRGHHHDAMVEAMQRCRGRKFEVAIHLILGLPGETHSMMHQSLDEAIQLGAQTLKLHNLYAVERTRLADQVRSGQVQLMELEEYVPLLVDLLERVPGRVVIERISGEAPSRFLVGPAWCRDKPNLQQKVLDEFQRRGSYQGFRVD
jgi:hypothetical protein